jgi:starch-binding outer membrane protein, SusD/RagB family
MKAKYSYLLSLLLAVMGCEDQLNLAPKNNLTSATYYKTADDAKAALSAAYGQLGLVYRDETIVTPNVVGADDGIPFLTGNANRVAFWNYAIIPANTFVFNIWSQSYIAIQRSNIVIERLPAIPMDETLKARYVAEAKFLRALHYFNLVRFFGEVPLVLNETTTLRNIAVPRNKVDDVYTQIETDLKEIESVLPKNYAGANADIGRVTQGAAKGLLAKVYLTRAGANTGSPFWAQAATKAKEVMDLGGYSLWPNYADVFALANKGGRESIFEVQYITNILGTNFSTGFAPRGAPIVPNNGSGILRVSGSLFDSYLAADRRRNVTFLTSYVSNNTTVNLSTTDSNPANAISFWKLADPTSTVAGNAGKSFPYMRYSEILLIYAEALNEANSAPTAEAYSAVNEVRRRAGLPDLVGLTQSQFREAIYLERRLELCFEGHRWFDLVRTGKLIEAVKAENSFNRNANIQAFNVLLPIPQQERDSNPNLSQNTGY